MNYTVVVRQKMDEVLQRSWHRQLSALRFVLAALWLGGSVLLCRSAQAELLAGAAKAEITPDVKAVRVPLGGYAARRAAPATGVESPIYARALVLSNGKTKVGIVSVDLCFLPANVKAEVMKRLAAAGIQDLPAAQLLIAATHAHTAPDPLAMHSGNTISPVEVKGWTGFDARLLAFTADRIAEAIQAANKQLVPAHVRSAAQTLPGRNRNRRGDPIVDTTMTLLKVTSVQGQVLASVVNFAAHPTLYGDEMMRISPDWPGVMTADVEKALGGVCLFLNGAEGDASPQGAEGKTEAERVADYGHKMGSEATERLKQITGEKADISLAAWTQTVVLPPRKPNGLFLMAAASTGATVEQAKLFVTDLMPQQTVLSFVRAGDLTLIGFPCEPTGALGMAAKEAARKEGVILPAVVALANDWLGYALQPAQYKEGKYETGMSFYGDQLGPTLLSALRRGLVAR